MKRRYWLCIALLFLSCVTPNNKEFKFTGVSRDISGNTIDYVILPATLKVLPNQFPGSLSQKEIMIDAAIGEGESAQLLVINRADEQKISCEISPLVSESGFTINAELGTVGYVPVKRPSLVGFKKNASFPDPVIPTNTAAVGKNASQSFLYTVYIPRTAPAGKYQGNVILHSENAQTITDTTVPVTVIVHNVILPVTGKLKTWFGDWFTFEEPYYKDNSWPASRRNTLYQEFLKYRINIGYSVDMSTVFSQDALGNIAANWDAFDSEVSAKLSQGISALKVYARSLDTDAEKAKLKLFYQHLLEKNWLDYFYWYRFDEPKDYELGKVNEFLDEGHAIAPKLKNLIPIGITSKPAMKKLIGHLDVWVPHIHQYNEEFFNKCRAAGDEIWIYTCVQNAYNSYPDNWKIDTPGTYHRALGWWLFKNNIKGYLYWAVGDWEHANPWETAETFPFGNGDGSLVYPALDKESVPYPSLRLHCTRDAFEDFDLLALLKEKYGSNPPEEVERLLSCQDIIYGNKKFSNDDYDYISAHKRILELLERAGE